MSGNDLPANEPSVRQLGDFALETFGSEGGCDLHVPRHERHEPIAFDAETVSSSVNGNEQRPTENKSTPNGG